jgi:hypothetical protein
MPVDIKVEKETSDAGLITYTVTGELVLKELKDALEGVYDDPDFRPGMHALWQIKEGTIGVSATELPVLIKLLEERSDKRGTGYKAAIVVRGNLDFGLSTLFQMNAYELPFEVKVFQSLTQARQWIVENKL